MMNTYQCKSDIISVNEKEKLLSAARTYKYVNYNTDKGTETGLEFISTLNERNKNSIPIDTIKQFINRVNPQCNFFIAAFIKFASKANIGMVGINIPIPVPVAYHSFGGWKDSLFGSNNAHGMDGVRFYTKIKTISSRWPSGIKEGALFTMPLMK